MILFVGEKPSKTAFEKGWTWESKRLASATLHEALERAAISRPVSFINLFGDHPDAVENLTELDRLDRIENAIHAGHAVIALGQKVSRILVERGVPHRTITHPAARGKIRGKAVYAAHLREVLGSL